MDKDRTVVVGRDGIARIKGTRVRVKDIVAQYRHALDELKRDFPHLSESQFQAALEYWRANPEKIKGEIEEERAVIRKLASA